MEILRDILRLTCLALSIIIPVVVVHAESNNQDSNRTYHGDGQNNSGHFERENETFRQNMDDELEPVTNSINITQLISYGLLHTLEQYQDWAAKEEKIVEAITKRLEFIKMEEELMTRYLVDYEESTGEAMKNLLEPKETPVERGRVVASGAVLAHRMTSRYAGVITQLRTLLASKDYLDNFVSVVDTLELKDEDSNTTYVGPEDLFMSMNTFIHFEEVYWIPPEQLMNGLEVETTSGGKLNPVHCIELGMFALHRRRYYMSLEWFNLAETLLQSQQIKEQGVSSDMVSKFLSVAIQQHNRVVTQTVGEDSYENFRMRGDTYGDSITNEQFHTQRVPLRQKYYERYKGFGTNFFKADTQFFQLCMGEKLRPVELEHSLKCYYENKRHPYLYINPVKTEVLSEDPIIYQFYEVIGNQTIEFVSNQNRPRVLPSQVVGSVGMEQVAVWRTSAGIGMVEEETPRKIYALAEYLTGLKIWNSSEPTQFVEYTFGRFYSNHGDAFDRKEEFTEDSMEENWNRIATMLYYLEIPILGGDTPFCQAGIWGNRVRGSAILWYNMYKNGTVRKDVDHGACPVIYGHKIIMNHWVYHHLNWNNRKCSLNQLE